jgi:hypothetical protein
MIKTTAVATKTTAATNWASDALQTQLNGKNLHEAFASGLLTNDDKASFGTMTSKYGNGDTYNRLVLRTKEADVCLSRSLQEKIEKGEVEITEEVISSLVFKKDISGDNYGNHAYFVLQLPGSGVERTFTAVDSFAAVVA